MTQKVSMEHCAFLVARRDEYGALCFSRIPTGLTNYACMASTHASGHTCVSGCTQRINEQA
eukprot:10361676-Alexandrium_andersonii.AAC.1